MASPNDIKETRTMYTNGIRDTIATMTKIVYRPYAPSNFEFNCTAILQIPGDG